MIMIMARHKLGLILQVIIIAALVGEISAKKNRKNGNRRRHKSKNLTTTVLPSLLPLNTTEESGIDAENVTATTDSYDEYLMNMTTEYPEGPAVTRQQDNFYFDPSPIGGKVVEGDLTRLRCDVSSRTHIAFYWTMDDRKVANTSRRFQEDGDLRIQSVDRKLDGGSFRCIATNVTTGMSLRSIEARLSILWIDKSAKVLLRNKDKEEVALGMELTLKCQVEGHPEPIVEWYKNNIRLFENQHIRIHKTRLKVMELTPMDNGVYSCKAKNLGGEVESSDNYILNIEGEAAAHLDLDTFTQQQLVARGAQAQFVCDYAGAILTEWYDKEQTRLMNSSKYTLYANGTLLINRIDDNDAGSYKCVGISEDGPVQSFVTELVLSYLQPLTLDNFDPKPPSSGESKVIPINQKYEVACKAPNGLPTPVLSWSDPAGMPVPDTGRIRAGPDDLILSINNAQPEDSGNYTCIAHNMAATHSANIHVVVSVAPEITYPPLSVRKEEGEDAQFQCKVSGTPYPVTTITWRKEEDPLDMSHPRYQVNQADGILMIKDVQLSDEGNYACVVNTSGHPVIPSTNAHLYVEKKLKFRPRPVNTKLELGSTARIHCRAEGSTQPEITWIKDGGASEFPEHATDVDGTLVFSGVEKTDTGNYTCTAKSEQGTISATIVVTVVVKPYFKVHPQNATAHEGYPVMIHCVAQGDPEPTIQWDKNSKVNSFDLERFKVLSNGSLLISEAYMEDIGRYGCTAGNSGGFQREEIYLGVISGMDGHLRNHPGLEAVDNFNMMKTIIIAVCSAVAYLAIVIGLTVYCSIRLLKAKQRKANENGVGSGATKENGTVPTEHTELMDKRERDSSVVKVMLGNGGGGGTMPVDDSRSHVSAVSSQPSSHTSSSRHHHRNYDKLAFPRHDLQTLGMLGKGHYGDVFLAKAHHIRGESEPETLVVVKSLLTRDEYHHREFRREMDMFSRAQHEHIVRLLGLCREMEPQFLITEYCEWGDLKQYLWATRGDGKCGGNTVQLTPLTTAQQVWLCQQVALGCEHLAALRIVHRDVAARNVLLTSTLHVKLGNLALCRDVYACDYYPITVQRVKGSSIVSGGSTNSGGSALMPLRWMAPESILGDEWSAKSDVWAWGCYVYEIFTQADQPYEDLDDTELYATWNSRGVTPCISQLPPPQCPPALWSLVERCLQYNPADRPSFPDICIALTDLTLHRPDSRAEHA